MEEEILFSQQTSREPGVPIEMKRTNQRSCLSPYHYGDFNILTYIIAVPWTDSAKDFKRLEVQNHK